MNTISIMPKEWIHLLPLTFAILGIQKLPANTHFYFYMLLFCICVAYFLFFRVRKIEISENEILFYTAFSKRSLYFSEVAWIQRKNSFIWILLKSGRDLSVSGFGVNGDAWETFSQKLALKAEQGAAANP